MGQLTAFVHVSIDGYYAGPGGEIDWFKSISKDDDYDAYIHHQSSSGGSLVFGRKTYEMMKSYWPTPQARKADPDMAEIVDHSPKFVFSRTLKNEPEQPNWKNITIVSEIDPAWVKKLKQEAKGDLTILGSGTVVQELANLGVIDEYNLVVVPVVLGKGKPLFEDVNRRI
ncbi:MAG: dihydrofolate reductase family protein [Acidobacteriota bacterium]